MFPSLFALIIFSWYSLNITVQNKNKTFKREDEDNDFGY
jgi:hypothetical protein